MDSPMVKQVIQIQFTNDKVGDDGQQQQYLQLLSNRSLKTNAVTFGPSFNLDPPKINQEEDVYEICSQNSDIQDIYFYIDQFDQHFSFNDSCIDTLNLHYDELIAESKKPNTPNGTQQQYLIITYTLVNIVCSQGKVEELLSATLDGESQGCFNVYIYKLIFRELERCQKRFVIHDLHLVNFIIMKKIDLLIDSQKYNKAMELLEKHLIKVEQTNWKVFQADILTKMGIIWALYSIFTLTLENFDYSKTLLVEAMSIYESYLNKTDSRMGECYYQFGIMSYLKDDFFYAEKYVQLALDIFKNNNQHPIIHVRCLNLLASVFQIQGINDCGQKEFEQALALCKQHNLIVLEARILTNMGHLCRINGKNEISYQIFQKALSIYKAVLPSWNQKIRRLELTQQIVQSP